MMADSEVEVLTIGHSTQSYEDFLRKLRAARVTAVADVRSAPFSRHFPHFNRDALKEELRMDSIAYVFLGDELGGRPKDKQFFCNGVADYEKMARTEAFAKGLDRVIEGTRKYRIALMCSEHDPLDCHRCLLVGRALSEKGISLGHILGNGRTVSHGQIESRLLEMAGRSGGDFFETPQERLMKAYRDRAMKVAYAERDSSAEQKIPAE
jgi:uncharacterized protein (DUF488 family)